MVTESMQETTQVIPATRGELFEKFMEQIHGISLPSQCLSTTRALSNDGGFCWGCLAKTYKGMVVLDRFQSIIGNENDFLIYAFTEKSVFADNSDPCFSHCGKIETSEECTSKPVHLINWSPQHDAFEWMERKRSESSQAHTSMASPDCFLIRHFSETKFDCLKCFPGKTARELSPITFLIELSTNLEVADNSECPFKKVSGCLEMERMPSIMCEFDSGRLKVDFDVNLASNEDNPSSPITNSGKTKPVHVAKVVAFEWHIEKSEVAVELPAIQECFMCLCDLRVSAK
uniref:AlNc14C529G12059 protein n=1 Tax=Albugo laibachii Nc14 TaxID=890382 RepID=F0WEN7_9STRA|nr:AlNc14C76G5087 [Albugo laibachii Nc14]CCA27414.1 AlNc14C529G12059 [Albugo laibachii Nc14]|eukprot:CCA27414.1 AlNc14C529G12059 [Albugo laibachii Nc14]